MTCWRLIVSPGLTSVTTPLMPGPEEKTPTNQVEEAQLSETGTQQEVQTVQESRGVASEEKNMRGMSS
jgi:hypothetical protein